jgi:voltage-gated potassium channel
MTFQVILCLLIITVTIFIHGSGTAWWLNYLLRKHEITATVYGYRKSMRILSLTAVFLMVLHYIEIALWAAVYLFIPHLDKLQTWEESVYFSMVTYTTLGYGDITLPPFWRIMSGFEAMNGILLFGWSTALFFAVVQRIVAAVNQKNS